MKRCFIILIGVLFIGSFANAQYRINKKKYDYRTYSHQVGDRYNPTVAGVASFFIPGLGQMISGAGLRGVAFLGGGAACVSVLAVEAFQGTPGTSKIVAGGAIIGMFVIYTWSIADAVCVAKVNNLAFRDKNKTSYLQVSPYIGSFSNEKIPIGISLKVRF